MKQYQLTVNQPCLEKWEEFKPTTSGGFCSVCSKNVVDFTTMTEKELMEYLLNSSGNTCGRFLKNQLNHPITPGSNQRKNRFGWSYLKTGLAGLSMILFSQNSLAYTAESKMPTIQMEKQPGINTDTPVIPHLIEGVVYDEEGNALPGVNVIIKGTSFGKVTDIDGKFSIEVNEGDILAFHFIGMETEEYKVGKEDILSLKIEMKMDECMLMGEVVINEVYQSKPSLWTRFKSLF